MGYELIDENVDNSSLQLLHNDTVDTHLLN